MPMRYQQRAAYLDMLREWTFLDTYENTPLPITSNGDVISTTPSPEDSAAYAASYGKWNCAYEPILDDSLYSTTKSVAMWLDAAGSQKTPATVFHERDLYQPISYSTLPEITEQKKLECAPAVDPEFLVNMSHLSTEQVATKKQVSRSTSISSLSKRSLSFFNAEDSSNEEKPMRPKKARRKSAPTPSSDGVNSTRDDRNRHNLIEKRYRDSLQLRLTKLSEALPVHDTQVDVQKGKKASDCHSKKAHILDEAVLYIGDLKKQKGVLEEQNAALKESLQEVYRLIQSTQCVE